MKLNNIMITVLWISLLAIPPSVQAGNDEVLRGFMGIMQEMQKQSGADADPNSKAIMDAFGKAIDGKNDQRRGKGDRQGKGKGDRQGKGRGQDDRQGKGRGQDDRQGKGRGQGDRQGKGRGQGDRQGKGNGRQAGGNKQRRQN
ncbi:MAG: hypothetical protein KDJ31_19475 [Candidatus Competibacteraceae bacterium]|nr:hypothetical protein [Candidatus Competibacteraceae bacterium]